MNKEHHAAIDGVLARKRLDLEQGIFCPDRRQKKAKEDENKKKREVPFHRAAQLTFVKVY
jgi:hypothetical protein